MELNQYVLKSLNVGRCLVALKRIQNSDSQLVGRDPLMEHFLFFFLGRDL